jgi:molecular chaperone HtpG
MQKLKTLRDNKEVDFSDDVLRIEINLDKEAKTITISDNGIGLTKEEVENYIAHLAFSGAEEFFKRYESSNEKDQIIGHFGLGFYSSFMVSDIVDIHTQSYKDEKPVAWSSDGSYEYTIEEGQTRERGTTITLHISEDSNEFLEQERLEETLKKYASFLPFPIYFGDKHINANDPLWLKNPNECTDQEYIDFYKKLHPFEPDPIFWVHLNVDYPFHVKGILYFPKITKRFDYNTSHMKLFCNRVFVSDNCKDLVPDYLMVLRGAIDSPDIPLNVSRSYLQMDKTVRSLSTHIAKKISDKLHNFYTNDKEKFYEAWADLEVIVKLGCLQDDKFYERMKDILVWKTTNNEWRSAQEYQSLYGEAQNHKIFYSSHAKQNAHFLKMYEEKNIEVLISSSPLDLSLMNHIESKNPNWKFMRVDASLEDSLLDASKEKSLLDSDGTTEASKIASAFESTLEEQNISVDAKSFATSEVPGFLVVDEQMRRMREYFALSEGEMPSSSEHKQTFMVNTNNPLILTAYELASKNSPLAEPLIRQIYDLSLLGQRELSSDDLSRYIQDATSVLTKLAEEIGD